MAVTFSKLWNELRASVPNMDAMAARAFVQHAWREIRESHDWSFLRERGLLLTPTPVSTGAVAATRGESAFTADATAKAALDLFGVLPSLAECQISVGGGIPYRITGYDSATGVVSIDPARPYSGTTNAAATYTILRYIFRAPADDFVRFLYVTDEANTLDLALNVTAQDVNRRDMNREDSGQPVCIFYLEDDTDGRPLYEMWPRPSGAQRFECYYRTRGVDFQTDASTLPSGLPSALVLYKAKMLAYEWAEANKGSHPQMARTNWQALMGAALGLYEANLKRAIKQDRERNPNRRIPSARPNAMRGDANYWQSHAPHYFNRN